MIDRSTEISQTNGMCVHLVSSYLLRHPWPVPKHGNGVIIFEFWFLGARKKSCLFVTAIVNINISTFYHTVCSRCSNKEQDWASLIYY